MPDSIGATKYTQLSKRHNNDHGTEMKLINESSQEEIIYKAKAFTYIKINNETNFWHMVLQTAKYLSGFLPIFPQSNKLCKASFIFQ